MARRIPTMEVPKTADIPPGNITSTEWLEAKSDIGVAYNEAQLSTTRTFDVRSYGATGDGVTDDTDAIEAAIADIPSETGIGGAELVFPYGANGRYRVTRPILIDKHGVHIRSTGGFSTLIQPTSDVTTSVFTFKRHEATIRGVRISNVRLYMNNSPANAIEIYGGYDNVLLDNVFVSGLNGSANGISILPREGTGNPISQTVTAINCWVDALAGWTGTAWKFHRLQEGTFVGCKGVGHISYGTGATGWSAHDCKSLAWYNCAGSNVDTAWSITAENIATVQGFTIDNPLFEQVGTAMDIRGGASGYPVARLSLRNPRSQSPVGPIVLTRTIHTDIDSMVIPVVINSTADQTIVRTRLRTEVTDNGSRTVIIEPPNAADTDYTISSSGFRYAAANGDTQLRIITPGNSGSSGTFVRFNVGGTEILKRLFVGPVDSGGTGYRAVRIEN